MLKAVDRTYQAIKCDMSLESKIVSGVQLRAAIDTIWAKWVHHPALSNGYSPEERLVRDCYVNNTGETAIIWMERKQTEEEVRLISLRLEGRTYRHLDLAEKMLGLQI